MPNIAELIGLPYPAPPVIRKLLTEKVECANPELIMGVELEIENLRDPMSQTVDYMHVVADNSLRNNGWEFISQPMKYRELSYVLNQLFQKNGFTAANYSERCSVHVHVNCTNLTTEELSSALLLYQVFEKLLYKFIGNERDGNIFCVPWYATNLNYQVLNNIETTGVSCLKRWQKYTGLNLLPLFEHGTVEFRQMHGNADLKYIQQWLNIIGSIFAYAKVNSIKDIKQQLLDLNTTSQYDKIVLAVFGKYSDLLLTGNYRDALEDGVITMKYSLLKPDGKIKWKTADDFPDPTETDGWIDDVEEDDGEEPTLEPNRRVYVNGEVVPRPAPREAYNPWIIRRDPPPARTINPMTTEELTAMIERTRQQVADNAAQVQVQEQQVAAPAPQAVADAAFYWNGFINTNTTGT